MDEQHFFDGILLEAHLIELAQEMKKLPRLEQEQDIIMLFCYDFIYLEIVKNITQSLIVSKVGHYMCLHCFCAPPK